MKPSQYIGYWRPEMERHQYIGSSDASDIIAGNYSYLYKLKTGALPPPDLSDNFKVQLGILTESFHLDWTVNAMSEEKGHSYKWGKTDKNDEQFFSSFTASDFDPHPVLGSHPDALLRDEAGLMTPIEVKHTGRWKSAEEAADFYMPQLQHHLICWDADYLIFSVICGTEEPERIVVGYSKEYADYYLERCATLWAFLKAEIPPAPQMVEARKPTIPTKVKDSVPIDGMTKRSLQGNNRAESLIPEFIQTKKQAARHAEVKDELKSMVGETERELYHPALTLKRNAKGSILFKVLDEDYGQDSAAEE